MVRKSSKICVRLPYHRQKEDLFIDLFLCPFPSPSTETTDAIEHLPSSLDNILTGYNDKRMRAESDEVCSQ